MVSGMCTLPINIINEKIYAVLWLLYIFSLMILMGKVHMPDTMVGSPVGPM